MDKLLLSRKQSTTLWPEVAGEQRVTSGCSLTQDVPLRPAALSPTCPLHTGWNLRSDVYFSSLLNWIQTPKKIRSHWYIYIEKVAQSSRKFSDKSNVHRRSRTAFDLSLNVRLYLWYCNSGKRVWWTICWVCSELHMWSLCGVKAGHCCPGTPSRFCPTDSTQVGGTRIQLILV